MTGVAEVSVEPVPLHRLEPLLTPERIERLETYVAAARELLEGRVVWNVNSTARGGGVAEMLRTLVAYAAGTGVDIRWLVVSGDPEFFAVTKRIHNRLHGVPGDAGEARRRRPGDVRRHAGAAARGGRRAGAAR